LSAIHIAFCAAEELVVLITPCFPLVCDLIVTECRVFQT